MYPQLYVLLYNVLFKQLEEKELALIEKGELGVILSVGRA